MLARLRRSNSPTPRRRTGSFQAFLQTVRRGGFTPDSIRVRVESRYLIFFRFQLDEGKLLISEKAIANTHVIETDPAIRTSDSNRETLSTWSLLRQEPSCTLGQRC